MVKVSFEQKPYRRALMETYGATCIASPSEETNSGRAILAQDPNSPGSLGIAISEAVEVAATMPTPTIRSAEQADHVLIHQSVIGIEAIEQHLEMAGEMAGHGHRLRRRRLEFRRPRRPLPWQEAPRRGRRRGSSPPSGGLPVAHPRCLRL